MTVPIVTELVLSCSVSVENATSTCQISSSYKRNRGSIIFIFLKKGIEEVDEQFSVQEPGTTTVPKHLPNGKKKTANRSLGPTPTSPFSLLGRAMNRGTLRVHEPSHEDDNAIQQSRALSTHTTNLCTIYVRQPQQPFDESHGRAGSRRTKIVCTIHRTHSNSDKKISL